MIIQFDTDHNIKGTEAVREPLIALITEGLKRHSAQITRIQVHLTDQNAKKSGENDKRCVLEARLAGMNPLSVSNDADTRDQAVEGAIDKMNSLLETTLDRKKGH